MARNNGHRGCAGFPYIRRKYSLLTWLEYSTRDKPKWQHDMSLTSGTTRECTHAPPWQKCYYLRVMQREIQRDGKCKEKTVQMKTTACKSVEETKPLYKYMLVLDKHEHTEYPRTMSSSDSSFSSSFFSSAGASAAGAPPPPPAAGAPTAGAPPPEPTLERSSFTSFPSRALARRVAQIASTSTPAALVMAIIFSD